jgi:hypothetical protein
MRDPLYGFPGWWPRHRPPGRVTHRLLYAYADQSPAPDCPGLVWTPLGGPYRLWEGGKRLYVAECQGCGKFLLIDCWPHGGTRRIVRELRADEIHRETTRA